MGSPRFAEAAASRASRTLVAAAVWLAGLGAGCSGGGGGGTSGGGVVPPPPNSNLFYVSDPHQSGQASSLIIEDIVWGRMVDVYDQHFDATAQKVVDRKVMENFLIGDDINNASNPLEFKLDVNAITGQERLIIFHEVGTPSFGAALSETTSNLEPIQTKDLGSLPPFSAVPRNAAILVRFNDLLDEATIRADTVQLAVGEPPSTPFECRILPDVSHGGLVGNTFHTTRVLIDLTVSAFESQQSGGALIINALGLPGANDINQSNALLRFPTKKAIGQFSLLANLTGHPVSFTNNGPNDSSSSTLDVLRAFRSQGRTEVTGDPNNGFLPDDFEPSILGSQPVQLTGAQAVSGTTDEYLVDLTFLTPSCAQAPQPGDGLQLPNNLLVQVVSGGTLNGANLTAVRVVVLTGNANGLTAGVNGQFRTVFDAANGVSPACFLRFSPLPGSLPATDVETVANVIVSFSEPMDPASVQALDTFTVRYLVPPDPDPMWENVVGRVIPSQDLRDFTFKPSVRLRHTSGTSESYLVEVSGDDTGTNEIEGITDLAGNPLTSAFEGLTSAAFNIKSTEATVKSAGIGFKFADLDENGDGLAELRGQFLINTLRQVVKPRSVSRFSRVLDENQPFIGAMPLTQSGLQTPLSNFGSKMMSLWRYFDMGFTLLDDTNHNLDVERLYWRPFSTAVSQDNFPNFQIALAHCFYLPDEFTDGNLLPQFRWSGVVEDFSKNLLEPNKDPLTIMAPKGPYFVDTSLSFPSSTGAIMMPWPVNLNVPVADYKYWTWRDTEKTSLGGCTGANCGPGADPKRFETILGTGFGFIGFYPIGKLPTIALPLLTEFRCYPDPNSLGVNGLKTSFALNSSSLPSFRAFSNGGVSGTSIITIDPDTNNVAQGGINPVSGQSTPPIDNTFYHGQADFVVRISRMHTIWLDTQGASTFGEVLVEPDNTVQPSKTQIAVAFRGASNVTTASGAAAWLDATNFDPYGEALTPAQLTIIGSSEPPITVTFFPANDKTWKSALTQINGARYVQMRVSFTSNAESLLSPELSSLGFGFTQ